MATRYQNQPEKTKEVWNQGVSEATVLVGEALEDLVRRGAKEMLRRALEEEVDAFLRRGRHERGLPFRGYRNGYAPERSVGSGLGAVEVRAPRVRDVPPEVAPEGYRSAILPHPSGGRKDGAARRRAGCLPSSTWKGSPAATSSRCFGPCWAKTRHCQRARCCA